MRVSKIYEEGEPVTYKRENLGNLEIVKGEIEITNVQENFL